MQKIIRRIGAKTILSFLNKFDEMNNSITTYRVKRLQIAEHLMGTGNPKFDKVGILVQGQLIPDVTFVSCRRYRTLYPNSKIVFSTWQGSRHRDIERIQNLGIHVIQNEQPEFPGPSNINLQIVSTKNGLDSLSEMGVSLVLKSRSDGILTADYLLEYLQFLFETYSENGKKIIIPSYNTFLFRLYSPTDQFQFGRTEILQKYWSCPLAENARIEFRFAESYLLREYLSSIGRNVSFTIEDSLIVYRDFFVIADNAELGLVLNKGTKLEVSNRWANDGFPQTFSEIHNWQWIELQKNVDRYIKYSQEIINFPLS